MKNSWMKEVKFDEKGLIPAIVQDAKNGHVLMIAYMNKEALLKTLSTRKAHFYSRSRRKLWMKGESSGHTQRVKFISLDCDGDALLVKVTQKGAACHAGYRSCFYRTLGKGKSWKVNAPREFDPEKVYGAKSS